MKRCVAWALLALVAVLPACYESDQPLDATPQLDLDPALLGAWRCVGGAPAADEKGGTTLTIETAARGVYRATLRDDGEASEVYEAYGSRIERATVLNLRELDEAGKPKKDWSFVRYQLTRPEVLLVELADHDALKGVDPSVPSLRKALGRHGKEDPFRLLCVCVRARKE